MAIIFTALLILLIFFSNPSFAHHGCSGGISGPGISGPIITLPARTLPKKKFFISLGVNYSSLNPYSSTTLISLHDKNIHMHDASNILKPSLSLGYGITDDFFISAIIPYLFKYDIRTAEHNELIKQGNSTGIGDITFYGEYRFYKNLNKDIHAALISGLKIPSGVKHNEDREGNQFEIDDQPGSGSWDPIIGLALSKGFKYINIDTSSTYKFSTMGVDGNTLGDVVSFNLAASHRVNNKYLNKILVKNIKNNDLNWDIILEGNGQWSEKSTTKHHGEFEKDNNHGGLIVFLTPGIRTTLNKKWIANIGVSLPVIQALNGEQRAPNANIVFGVTRVFN